MWVGLTGTARAAAPPASAAAPTPAANTSGNKGPLVTGGIDEKSGSLRLLVNKSATITTSRPYKRVSINQPDIAEANLIGPMRILIDGKKAGATQLIIWDEDDNSQTIDVLVQANLLQLRDLYSRLLPTSKIDVIDNEGTIALTGQVPTLTAGDQAAQLASGYGQKVLNMLEVAGGQEVLLQVRFAEVSKSASTALGVNFAWFDPNGRFINNTGQLAPFGLGGNGIGAPDITGPSDFPGANMFARIATGNSVVDVFVQALKNNNLLRVLAEPNLVATSGQEADFLAGGEFPVPIVQASGGQSAVTVEMIQFGVMLRFTPVVLGGGKVRLTIKPEVSDVDFTNAPTIGGFRVPGKKIRRLSTTVELSEGQTFALAGLLDNRVASNKEMVPLLGDLPVVGALFRSVRYLRNETEMVVLCTPRLVRALNPGDVPALPGEDWKHPSELNMFMSGEMGNARHEELEQTKYPPRRYIGSYGLQPAPDPNAEASYDKH